MASKLEKAVTREEDGTYTFACPASLGCGVDARDPGAPGFRSDGWPTKKSAVERGAQHFNEHVSGEAAPPLHEFLAAQGLAVVDGKAVVVEITPEDLP